jgi:hypothetical protein
MNPAFASAKYPESHLPSISVSSAPHALRSPPQHQNTSHNLMSEPNAPSIATALQRKDDRESQ